MSRRTRLSADAWCDGVIDLMAEGASDIGINAVCQHLGVTRGSFYWHFDDHDELVRRVARRWCSASTAALGDLADDAGPDPRARLRSMTLRLLDPRVAAVERTLRARGHADDQVAGAMAESDLAVLGVVQAELLALGRDPDEARTLAGLLVFAGIGFAHGLSGLPTPSTDEIDRVLALLL